ncbi:MAG: hypothetical protein HFG62_00970 [Lachnospiraceae bacterium]|nr:hypothetical protein [Lachnospiraceae bacterium]
MFTVSIPAVAGTLQELHQSVGRLDQQIDQVEGILLRIRKIPEYDEVRSVLKKHLEEMWSEKCQMTELLAALSEIQSMYGLAEYYITDYGRQLQKIK